MKNLWIVDTVVHDENSFDILVGGDWSDSWYRAMSVSKDLDTSHLIVFVNDGRITDMKMSNGFGWVESVELLPSQKEQVVKFLNDNKEAWA